MNTTSRARSAAAHPSTTTGRVSSFSSSSPSYHPVPGPTTACLLHIFAGAPPTDRRVCIATRQGSLQPGHYRVESHLPFCLAAPPPNKLLEFPLEFCVRIDFFRFDFVVQLVSRCLFALTFRFAPFSTSTHIYVFVLVCYSGLPAIGLACSSFVTRRKFVMAPSPCSRRFSLPCIRSLAANLPCFRILLPCLAARETAVVCLFRPPPYFLHYVRHRCLLRRRICLRTRCSIPVLVLLPASCNMIRIVISAYLERCVVFLPPWYTCLGLSSVSAQCTPWVLIKACCPPHFRHLFCASPLFSVGQPCASAYVSLGFRILASTINRNGSTSSRSHFQSLTT